MTDQQDGYLYARASKVMSNQSVPLREQVRALTRLAMTIQGQTWDFDGVHVTVTRSVGADNAMVVFVDTDFEPDGSDGRGLRVHINDDPIYIGVDLDDDGDEDGESDQDRAKTLREYWLSMGPASTPTTPDRSKIREVITNAYYDARNNGLTMENAADNAAEGVVSLLKEET